MGFVLKTPQKKLYAVPSVRGGMVLAEMITYLSMPWFLPYVEGWFIKEILWE